MIYQGDYHVDLPIYGEYNGQYYLARTGDVQWIKSDPKAFRDWFIDKVNTKSEQLRRIVQYLKAWKDFNDLKITGMMITILVGDNFIYQEHEDSSLVETVKNIIISLESTRAIYNPVDSSENLLGKYNNDEIEEIVDEFKNLRDEGLKALGKDSKEESSKIWISIFGDRFPLYKEEAKAKLGNVISIGTPLKPWGEK